MIRDVIGIRVLIGAASLAALSVAPAQASPAQVAPDGWTSQQRGALTVYRSASGREALLFREVEDASDPALAIKLIADGMTQNADRMIVDTPSQRDGAFVHDLEYARRGMVMQGKVIGVRQSNGVFLALAHMAPKAEPGLAARLEQSVQRMAALAGDSAAITSTPVAQTPAPKPMPQPVQAMGPGVAHILFELKYSYGVGGAVLPTYNLVALLKNGQAAQLGSYATDAIDVAAIGRKKRGHVGTWQRAGGIYKVRWQDGDTSDLKPTVGPPTPLPGKAALRGTYQAIGGGGNTALGGQTMTAEVKQFTFRSDGTFSHSSRKSVSSSAAVGGARSGTAGRWSLNGPNLTLNYNNGRVVRTSVFYSQGRKRTADFGQTGVLWIGGEDYRRVR